MPNLASNGTVAPVTFAPSGRAIANLKLMLVGLVLCRCVAMSKCATAAYGTQLIVPTSVHSPNKRVFAEMVWDSESLGIRTRALRLPVEGERGWLKIVVSAFGSHHDFCLGSY